MFTFDELPSRPHDLQNVLLSLGENNISTKQASSIRMIRQKYRAQNVCKSVLKRYSQRCLASVLYADTWPAKTLEDRKQACRHCHSNIYTEMALPWGLQPLFHTKLAQNESGIAHEQFRIQNGTR